jgi:sulfate adenylyltransferase subunit 1
VALRLADDIDITRGDLIAAVDGAPEPVTEIDAMVAWLGDRPLHPGDRVFLKHATRTVQARVDQVRGRLDLDTAELEAASCLELNDIGRVSIRLASPILAEDYAESRTGGAFLLVDAAAGLTLAAGMIRPPEAEAIAPENDIDWQI